MFHGLRLKITVTESPGKALVLAAEAPPDLLVLDLATGQEVVVREVALALRALHPLARLRVAVRTDLPPEVVTDRLAPFGAVDVIPRQGGIAAVLGALEAIATREGLLDHRKGELASSLRSGRSCLPGC